MAFINDEEIDIEELHYQMASMHQNVKKLQKDTWVSLFI